MEYAGTVLIMDGESDLSGESFSTDSVVNIKDGIPVTLEFNSKIEGYLGEALLIKNNGKIDYRIRLNEERITDQLARLLTPCVGGFIKKRDGRTIKEFTINSIGLSVANADKRIKKLGEE